MTSECPVCLLTGSQSVLSVPDWLHVVGMVTLFFFQFDFSFCGCCIYVPAFCPPPLPPHLSPFYSSPLLHLLWPPPSLCPPPPLPPMTQGSWWSNRRAVSPPSSSQDSMGEGGWDSPKPRSLDSPLWSMRVVNYHTLTLIGLCGLSLTLFTHTRPVGQNGTFQPGVKVWSQM